MGKKSLNDNGKNTPCPKDADKIFYTHVKFFDNIPDILIKICLVLKNFITHSINKLNVHRT
jgi:hypothetical protein